MAGTIAKLYFPATDDSTSLLLFLGTFGVTFFTRPVGAIVLGNLGDRIGRTKVMSMSLLLMTVGMLVVALVPAYSSIGIAAPILVVGGRMLQGFSAGGEFGSSTALLVEHYPRRRGFVASWQAATQGFAMMAAAGLGAFLSHMLTPNQFTDWGWRVPFALGALIGPIGLYMRRSTSESSEYATESRQVTPMLELLKRQRTEVLIAAGLIVLATIEIWMSVFMPVYAAKHFHIDPEYSFLGAVTTGAVIFILSPFVGYMSDFIGRTPTMIVGVLATLGLAYPAFAALQMSPTVWTLIRVQGILGVVVALYFAPLPALMSEIFPKETRTSGLSLSYNLGVTVFGGFAPFFLTEISVLTPNPAAPSYYVIFGGAISALAICGVRKLLHLR